MTQPENKKDTELHESATRQLRNTALGEMTAFSIAIGAVYASEMLLPKHTQALVARLAEHLGQWRGVSAETQTGFAQKILDVGIMNMAGASSFAVQFGLRRSYQSAEEKTPLWYEAGRLVAGRIVGTMTAIGALAVMGTKAPGVMRHMETGMSGKLGANIHADRFAELFVSNAVQSLGAIAGNAPAQLLYDHVVNPPKQGMAK